MLGPASCSGAWSYFTQLSRMEARHRLPHHSLWRIQLQNAINLSCWLGMFASGHRAITRTTCVLQLTRISNVCSDGFLELTGYTREDVLMRNCRFLQGPGTSQATIGRIRQACKYGQPLTELILNYRKDGVPFWSLFRLIVSSVSQVVSNAIIAHT